MQHRYTVNDQGGAGKLLFQFDGESNGEGELPEDGTILIIPESLRKSISISSRYCQVRHIEVYRQGGLTDEIRKVYSKTITDEGLTDPEDPVSEYYIGSNLVYSKPMSDEMVTVRTSKLRAGASSSQSKNPQDWTWTFWLPDPNSTCKVLKIYEWRDEDGTRFARRTLITPL